MLSVVGCDYKKKSLKCYFTGSQTGLQVIIIIRSRSRPQFGNFNFTFIFNKRAPGMKTQPEDGFIGDVFDHGQIMGNEKIGEFHFRLKLQQQI